MLAKASVHGGADDEFGIRRDVDAGVRQHDPWCGVKP